MAGTMARERAGLKVAQTVAVTGIAGDFEAWLARNLLPPGQAGAEDIAPFPPAELMHNTTGLTEPAHFASHGVDFMRALARLSPVPLADIGDILDFGVGVGRLARLFRGCRGRYVGLDVDGRHIAWVAEYLDHVEALETQPRALLPLADNSFDAVVSISVFSHLSEADHLFYLGELARVVRPGALLFLSIHGARALRRALAEEPIFAMLAVPQEALAAARARFDAQGYAFIRQDGHLSSETYDYGITFISPDYVRRHWDARFEVVAIGDGALHDFQDVVVLRAR